MPTKKKYNKSSRSKKQIKNKTIRKRIPFFSNRILGGGSDFGPASWNSSMSNPYTMYSQNDYVNDPSNPSIGNVSARNISGGRKNKKTTQRLRGIKRLRKSNNIRLQGGNGSPFGTGSPISNMPGFSFGTTSGVTSANILVNSSLPLSSVPYDNNNFVSAIL